MTNQNVVVVICGALRLLISATFPSLRSQLDNTVEFSTPFTSFKSLSEGVFLYDNGFPLYNGGVVHHSPLLIAFMSVIMKFRLDGLLYAVIDCIICWQLMEIVKSNNATILQLLQKKDHILIGIIYALNPLLVLSNISGSTVIFTHFAISSALYFSSKGRYTTTTFFMALASSLSIYSILLVIPFLALNVRSSEKAAGSKQFKMLLRDNLQSYLLFFSLLLLWSYKVSYQSFDFLSACYFQYMTFAKSFPNIGLWWYFFIEMFSSFIPFFKGVFNLLLVCFILPFTIRFNRLPIVAFVLSLGWIVLINPYPTLGAYGFLISLVPLFDKIYGYMKYPVISFLLLMHAVILSPLFYHLWIDLGSGNSNFFFALTFVYALGLSSILSDLIWGSLRLEYDGRKQDFNKRVTQI